MYHPIDEVQSRDTHGQSWVGETVEQNILLCDYQLIAPVFLQYLPRTGKVLESGCGLGRWVFYLRRKGYTITGIDLARVAVEVANAYDPTAEILVDDVLHSRFPNGSFDAVISLGVVEHFEDGPQGALAEFRRLLSNGGQLLISHPLQNPVRRLIVNRLKEFYRWIRERKGMRFTFEEYRFTRKEFRRFLEEAGFEIIDVVPDDYRPPLNMGLYVDFPFLRNHEKNWQLNAMGNLLASLLHWISPWTACAGAFWICRKHS